MIVTNQHILWFHIKSEYSRNVNTINKLMIYIAKLYSITTGMCYNVRYGILGHVEYITCFSSAIFKNIVTADGV